MHTILSILVENESGALSRVVGLFSQRGFNIESLTVAPTEDLTLSRITIKTRGDQQVIEQIQKQLHKLIDVLRVNDITDGSHVERELMIVKLAAAGEVREEVKRCVDIFRASIIDVTSSQYVVQMIGTSEKLDAFLAVMNDVTQVIEVARSGVVAMYRGDRK